MSAFNTSTRKEDVSTRLKAHSLRNAKDQTKQLESESRKMEERLKELKLAMTREKEERERQGGIFWKSGQHGALNNHAQNVLSRPPGKPKEKGQRTRKIKVLKETPIETPNRSKAPGTMAFIAQRDSGSNKDTNRSKGPKCGQCEQKSVSVSCMECSENYCAQCFAAFHMKGALRKHRSIPFKMGARPAPTPRPLQSTQPANYKVEEQPSYNKNHNSYSSELGAASSQNGFGDTSSSEEASFNGPSLLDGAYNENESAESFQQALKAWRTGGAGDANSTIVSESTSKTLKPRAITPVKSPIVIIESSTSTGNDDITKRDIDISFNSTVSYTEKLLLKHHRRHDVDTIQLSPRAERMTLSPRENSARSSYRGDSVSPYSRPLGSPRTSRKAVDISDEDRVDFQSLFQAVSMENRKQPNKQYLSEPHLSIEDISLASSRHTFYGLEEASLYQVDEIDDLPNNTGMFVSVKPANKMAAMDPIIIEPASPRTIRTPSIEPVYNDESNRSPMSRAVSQIYAISHHDPKTDGNSTRPQSRLKSGGNSTADAGNRPKSVAKSRPESRTRPRSSREKRVKSRASSRAGLASGGLTKQPSDSLSSVARMTPVELSEPQGLAEFFTAGVDPTRPGEDKVLVPTADKAKAKNNRPETPKKVAVSNKLYQMAPKTWRPDSSLGSTVNDSDVYNFYQDFNIRDFLSDPPADDGLDNDSTISFSLNAAPPSLSGRQSLESNVGLSGNLPGAKIPSPVQEGRQSRAVVVDGDDLSKFDFKDNVDGQNMEDAQTLDQLEWELASESGRLTADGKISRMLSPSGDDLDIDEDNGRGTGLSSPHDGYDVDDRLRDEDLMDDFVDSDDNCEKEVQALF